MYMHNTFVIVYSMYICASGSRFDLYFSEWNGLDRTCLGTDIAYQWPLAHEPAFGPDMTARWPWNVTEVNANSMCHPGHEHEHHMH